MNSLHIAIVDDDRGFAGALGHFLTDKGFEVNRYASGTEAVRGLATSEPGLAVVDAHLPDMHGTEVITRLHNRHPDVPVLIVTGDATEANMGRCRRSDVEGVIIKPVNPDHLYHTIQQILAHRPAR